jgi:hypothetical protein
VPKGKELHHNCENKLCVNPTHLELLGHREHQQRHAHLLATLNRAKTHCPRGHPYSGENLSIGSKGERRCRKCHAERARRYRQRKKDILR